MSLSIVWSSPSATVNGNDLSFPVTVAGAASDLIVIDFTVVSSPDSTDFLENMCLYLTGPDALTVYNVWPTIGAIQLNGGLDISFDNGQSYTRFSATAGNPNVQSTWIPIPAIATSFGNVDGELLPFDTASFQVRLVVPPGITDFHTYSLSIGLDADVV